MQLRRQDILSLKAEFNPVGPSAGAKQVDNFLRLNGNVQLFRSFSFLSGSEKKSPAFESLEQMEKCSFSKGMAGSCRTAKVETLKELLFDPP